MANDINKDNFSSEVLENDKLVLVDFWAEWCGPCKQISPRLEELANKYSENLTVCKVNVDENTEVPVEYGIRNIPTLLIFKNGELVDKIVGVVPKQQLIDKLESFA